MTKIDDLKFDDKNFNKHTEFEDLSEKEFKDLKKIYQVYTDACEALFVDVLKRAVYRYAETGEVPKLGLAMENFTNGK